VVRQPPWHHSTDCIASEYWADPSAVAALLPLGMNSNTKSGERAFLLVPRLAAGSNLLVESVSADHFEQLDRYWKGSTAGRVKTGPTSMDGRLDRYAVARVIARAMPLCATTIRKVMRAQSMPSAPTPARDPHG
jgi:hypothetical protein